MPTQTLNRFNQFLEFKEDFLNDAFKNAAFFEQRGEEKLRPLVKIHTEKELIEFNKSYAYWSNTVDELVKSEPQRFKENSAYFAPLPKLLMYPEQAFLRKNTAVSSRKVTKKELISRLERRLAIEISKSGSPVSLKLDSMREEIARFETDPCQNYRVRGHGYTDYILIYRLQNEKESSKVRLSRNGVFLYDPDGICVIKQSDGYANQRKDSLYHHSNIIKPIECSLYNNKSFAVLMKESDVLKLKELKQHFSKSA